MAKDPAFLFYPDNFMSGTMFLSDEQVGKYIRLLCAQHLTGHLSEKDMLKICKSYDDEIFNKFSKDEDGKFFNERLEIEINKRKAFSDSRSKNRKGNKKDMSNISKTSEQHLENGNGNGNVDSNYIMVSGKKITDPLDVLNFYEVQLNGTQKENGNIAWRPQVPGWMSQHLQEDFTDALHVKNSFKKYYLQKKPGGSKPPRVKAFEL